MSNPATRVTTALTYMGGLLVDPWKEQQMEELQRHITRGIADTDERHWTIFEQMFKDTFYNVNIKAEAYQKLENLKMKDNLDYFISEFKRLVTASGIDIDSHSIIHLFKWGLSKGLTIAIINSQGYNLRNPWNTFQPWEDAACSCNLRWKHTQEYRNTTCQGYYTALGLKPCGQQQSHRGGGQRLTMSQGGHHMDIDTTIASNITGRGPELTEARKVELQASNSCFHCQKKGHLSQAKLATTRNAFPNNPRTHSTITSHFTTAPNPSSNQVISRTHDHGNLSHDLLCDLSHDLPVPNMSCDLTACDPGNITRNLPKAWSSNMSQDHTWFGYVTCPLINTWKTVGRINKHITVDQSTKTQLIGAMPQWKTWTNLQSSAVTCPL